LLNNQSDNPLNAGNVMKHRMQATSFSWHTKEAQKLGESIKSIGNANFDDSVE